MNNYMLLYRADISSAPQVSPEQAQATTRKWMDWLGSIAAQSKLTEGGHRLETTGKVIRNKNVVTNGPYTEIKESIGGYSIIKAESYDEAVAIAGGCPIYDAGGSVEVRLVSVLPEM